MILHVVSCSRFPLLDRLQHTCQGKVSIYGSVFQPYERERDSEVQVKVKVSCFISLAKQAKSAFSHGPMV